MYLPSDTAGFPLDTDPINRDLGVCHCHYSRLSTNIITVKTDFTHGRVLVMGFVFLELFGDSFSDWREFMHRILSFWRFLLPAIVRDIFTQEELILLVYVLQTDKKIRKPNYN